MGAKVAANKSFNFTNSSVAEKLLRDTWWPVVGSTSEVVDSFRYLGSHMNVAGRGRNTTHTARVVKAVVTTSRVARLPVPLEDKAQVICIKVLPAALYGTETYDCPDSTVAKLLTTIARAVSAAGNRKDIDLVYAEAAGAKDIDPTTQLFVRKALAIRRVVGKKPDLKNVAEQILGGTW